ncbi:hypothetical protein [Pedobacter sandarakinus]|uniref:hypothetical protein n=1 Tax=Pedobacter sandarakinus TaxID=353156 RepID=UPI0022479D90|nr:hypothetical protein [Pedobacter sandarakinus]MCX2573544.1 hypothetical protein [Pedobacter sandarakinus]
MKKLIFFTLLCTVLACKKGSDQKLADNNWQIQSSTITPALTTSGKTSTNYIELMGAESCIARMSILFNANGTYIMSSNGALCDMFDNFGIKTWRRDGNKIFLSAFAEPLMLDGKKLTQTTTFTAAGGTVYTLVSVYKAKSK